ncbi:MAG: phosphoglycolate phosphatase [Solirubrobacteraceae bacterium]|nr:phosphoglycolate phosphatase [Solirubrobacteraceae bacterium]
MTKPLLLLWDIDGTLLQRASLEHAEAMRAALVQVHGELSLDGHRVEAAGRTDGAIARDLLVAAGLAPPAIDARADDVVAACCALYDELCPADLSPRLAPGVSDALVALGGRPDAYRFSLVTGNYERIARLKLARAGIGDWFPEGQGAFGSDAEQRERLPPLARSRAGDWPRERTVVIGDTPRDIACARADGVRVIAVATGPYGVEALADADAVVDSAASVAVVLEEFL